MALAADQNSSGRANLVGIFFPGQRDVTIGRHDLLVGSNSTQPVPGTNMLTQACDASAPVSRSFSGGREVTMYPLTCHTGNPSERKQPICRCAKSWQRL